MALPNMFANREQNTANRPQNTQLPNPTGGRMGAMQSAIEGQQGQRPVFSQMGPDNGQHGGRRRYMTPESGAMMQSRQPQENGTQGRQGLPNIMSGGLDQAGFNQSISSHRQHQQGQMRNMGVRPNPNNPNGFIPPPQPNNPPPVYPNPGQGGYPGVNPYAKGAQRRPPPPPEPMPNPIYQPVPQPQRPSVFNGNVFGAPVGSPYNQWATVGSLYNQWAPNENPYAQINPGGP